MNVSKYLFPIVLFANSYSCGSQSISNEAVYDLYSSIGNYLIDNDTMPTGKTRCSEFFTILLEVDNLGKISTKHVLSNIETGSKTNLFSEMPISIFQNWQNKEANNKIIIIPLLYISQNKSPEFINKMRRSNSAKRISVLDEEENKIYLSMFEYQGPIEVEKGK